MKCKKNCTYKRSAYLQSLVVIFVERLLFVKRIMLKIKKFYTRARKLLLTALEYLGIDKFINLVYVA